MRDDQRARLKAAIETTEYKYFGDYEFTDRQRDAVEVLVEFAQAALDSAPPSPAFLERKDVKL